MFVIKRNGRKENVSFDKVSARVKKMCYGLEDSVDLYTLSQQVILGLYDGVTTVEIDNLIAESAAAKSTQHYNYSVLASRIAISSLHKTTDKSYLKVVKALYSNIDEETGEKAPLVTKQFYEFVRDNVDIIEAIPIYDRDFDYDYFGFKTLQRGYLLKVNKKIVERPQHMLLRVAIGIHMNNIDRIKETYELLSQRWFTHATPTLFNAGTPRPQLSSCFLMTVDDSISGMYKTLSDCAQISKYAGGIGIDISRIRGEGAYIKGTGGYSNGIIPMLKVFNEAARHVDQGGGRRKGSFAIYLEPWHSEIFEFLDLKKNHGKEEQRARDLFYALWVSDLFMKRVENNEDWTLFSPNKVPLLTETYGDDFEKAYIEYEKQGLGYKTVKAQSLWTKIIETQQEVGIPYLLFKDSSNSKSNQQNLGIIRSSNLCCEVLEYTSDDEIAVCNLASISLPKFFINGEVDYKKLHEVTQIITRNLDTVIDVNYYPVIEAQNSNFKHRPIGIGVQGLADLFILLRLPFTSDKAKQINKNIFETIYHAAVTESIQLAKEKGKYSTFEGSPISKGLFQFDLWNVVPSDRYDWDILREEIKLYGVRNSLLLAPMPTASCVIKETKIITKDGIQSYTEILNDNNINYVEIEKTNEKKWYNLTKKPLVLTKDKSYVECDKIRYNGLEETLKIEMEDGTVFECTKNHKFLIRKGKWHTYVEAQYLKEDDDIVNINDKVNNGNSPYLVKYWTKKGFSEQESIEKIKEYKTKKATSLEGFISRHGESLGTIMFEKFKNTSKHTEEKYLLLYGEEEGRIKWDKYTNSKKNNSVFNNSFWLNQGYNENESELLRKEFHSLYLATSSVDFWINKGLTLEKAIEKVNLIMEKRQVNFLNASKESLKVFKPILKILNSLNIFYNLGVKGNKEFSLYDKVSKKIRYYDLVIPSFKIIIEYNGEKYHPNKNILSKEDWDIWQTCTPVMPTRPIICFTAEEVYERDKQKKELAESFGYKCYYIWSNDPNKTQVVNDIINLINNKYLENENN